MQILAWLKSAYRVTGNESYADALNFLVRKHGYATNIKNLKITVPGAFACRLHACPSVHLPACLSVVSWLPSGVVSRVATCVCV